MGGWKQKLLRKVKKQKLDSHDKLIRLKKANQDEDPQDGSFLLKKKSHYAPSPGVVVDLVKITEKSPCQPPSDYVTAYAILPTTY